MYAQKLTKEAQRIKLQKVRDALDGLEFDPNKTGSAPIIHAWKIYQKLPRNEKQRILEEWGIYYQSIKETPIYYLFKEQRESLEQKNYGRVKELSQQARQMRENGDNTTLKKPTTIDPWEFEFGYTMKCFFTLQDKLKELSDYSQNDMVEAFS